MVNPSLVPAIREAIKQNEIGAGSPYCLSYARLGISGASFGIFQGDTNVNHVARSTLAEALELRGASADTIARIIAAVSQSCPEGNPLTPEDTDLANSALSSPAGQTLVDQMDATLLQVVLGELDTSVAAASSRNLSFDPIALLYIAVWVNMTGAPNTLNKWLAGTPEIGVIAPAGPLVTQQNVQNYLHANTYFRLHPENFVHMQDSVQAAIPLLPVT
jgi:hypothetical protein